MKGVDYQSLLMQSSFSNIHYSPSISTIEQLLTVIDGNRCTYWEFDFITGQFYFMKVAWDAQNRRFTAQASVVECSELFKHLHPSDQHRLQTKLRLHEEGIEPVFRALVRYRKDANHVWHWFTCRGRIVSFEKDQPKVVAGVYQNVTREQNRQEQLKQMAKRDPLTGLPNRYALQETFAHCQQHSDSMMNMALFYLDLDGFKEVNDKINHRAGDELLTKLAHKLNHLTRHNETVYRIGGDEFALFVPRYNSKDELAILAERITKAFHAEQVNMYGTQISIGVSVGIATYRTTDTLDSLLERADTRMYRVKNNGKSGYWLGSSQPNHCD
ncbi:GGDEF domain-containing protein [Celerinatantimonas sp. MCCC 1A17872]|uniref:GGDEF domain-containing protein n=1 Tax=Celerinatantimonas sp. MCCC 1A17872 TaxID=3177514 RepID=UPI0038C5497B